MKEERDDKILDLYLQCWTQQQIADELNVDQAIVTRTIKDIMQNGNITTMHKDLYKDQIHEFDWTNIKNVDIIHEWG